MKALVIRVAVVVAVMTSFTVSAEAQTVQMESVSNVTSISITSSTSAVGVLAGS